MRLLPEMGTVAVLGHAVAPVSVYLYSFTVHSAGGQWLILDVNQHWDHEWCHCGDARGR